MKVILRKINIQTKRKASMSSGYKGCQITKIQTYLEVSIFRNYNIWKCVISVFSKTERNALCHQSTGTIWTY